MTELRNIKVEDTLVCADCGGYINVEDLKIEIARLTAELAEKGEYENKLVNTVDFMQTEIDRLTAELNEAQRYIKALEANTSKSVMKRLKVMVKSEER